MGELRLEAREWQGPARWRWVLTTGPDGRFLAEHEVRLDEDCWQYAAFVDLRGYLRWRVAPDRRLAHEAEIVAQVGEWIGAEVFGAVGAAMVARRPATVRVVVPEAAGQLAFRPLELGHVGGRPLAVQNVTLAMHAGAAAPPPTAFDVRELGGATALPRDVTELCDRVGQVPGADLDRLLADFTDDRPAAQSILEELIGRVRAMAGAQE